MAKAKKEDTQLYIVTRAGVTTKPGQIQPCEIGDAVELTEKQAAGRVNKVILKSEADAAAGGGVKADERLVKRALTAEDEAAMYRGKCEASAKVIKELKQINADLKKAPGKGEAVEAGKRIGELETVVADLTTEREAWEAEKGEAVKAFERIASERDAARAAHDTIAAERDALTVQLTEALAPK